MSTVVTRHTLVSAHRRVWKLLSDADMLQFHACKCTKSSGRVRDNKTEAQNTSKRTGATIQ